ncbi:MAG: hypothetical protein DI498_11000 [Paracoccus denitrificans]|nr:MAG: hypothetical protein DI498_11000 [Paracoccus denitrificans]PZO83668.1 MAG: hypothetical protein DI633_11000 [Paracoccus denitrificans]
MSQSFNIAMVLRADVSSAKAALKDVTGGLKEVEATADRSKGALQREAVELEALAAAAAKAALSADELAAAEKRRQSARVMAIHGPVVPAVASNANASWRTAETAATSLQKAVSGLNASLGSQAREAVEAAQGARAWKGAMDEVRASFNPLFAASRQYELELRRIADAEELGAISAREAAAARSRAAAQLAPVTQGPANRNGTPGTHITANLAAQGNDIVMMAMAGQSPLQLALQQGTQVSQVFNSLEKGTSITSALAGGIASMINPVSLATIGIIALGTFGVQALTKLIPPQKSAADGFKALTDGLDRYASRAAQVGSADELSRHFGSAALQAQGLLRDIQALERMKILKDSGDWMGAAGLEIMGGPDASIASQFGTLQRMFGEASWYNAGGLGRINEASSPRAWEAREAVRNARDVVKGGGSIDEQIAAAERLKAALDPATTLQGKQADQAREWVIQITEGILKLKQLKALDDNSANTQAARQLTADLQRQAALQSTIAIFGKDSAEVRRLELVQSKLVTAEKLRQMGFDSRSIQFKTAMAAIDQMATAQLMAQSQARRDADSVKLADLAMERTLIGATNAERARATAMAQVDRDIQEQKVGLYDALIMRANALLGVELQIGTERKKADRDRQLAMTTDAIDAQIGLARDPLTRADLEAQREYARVLNDTKDATLAQAEASRVRTKTLTEAINAGRVQASDMIEEVVIRQRVAAQVAAGTTLASEANRVIQQELALRTLVRAAARAEGDEKRDLQAAIEGARIAQAAMAAEDRRGAQNEYLRGATERVEQARLELALIGQSATVHARVLAMVQAEREIRAQGLTGEGADYTRRQARLTLELNQQIEAQADAWRSVQSAGESAIDAVFDKLKGGDLKGALGSMLDELNKGFFQLGVANPLKNMIFGSNLGTLDDVGGVRGIMARLSGKTPLDEAGLIAKAAQPVQAMQIAAASVTINAAAMNMPAGAQGLLAGLPGATANMNSAPFTDKNGVAAQIWNFFSGKGLASHQVAAILGHANAESGFNPGAVGDGGNAHGLFQWNDRRHKLFSHIGGRQNIGDVQKQLEFMWHEFMTTESGAYSRLKAAPDVRSATWAMQGFERPSGYKANAMGSGMHWDKRLAGAEQAMTTFANTTASSAVAVQQIGQTSQAAAGQVDQMGAGMGQFGGALQQILGSAVSGDKGGLLGGLISLGGQWLMSKVPAVPGFSAGGPTGGSDPARVAGVVHEQEFVFSAPAVRRIGPANLEALHRGSMRGFRAGGRVTRSNVGGGAAGSGVGPSGGSGSVTFAPSFDLRGATDPMETRRQAMRGMEAALEAYDKAMPRRMREITGDRKVVV